MLVAIRGAGTNIRSERDHSILGTIPRGGLVLEHLHDDGDWAVYRQDVGLVKISKDWHQRVEVPSHQIEVPFVSQLGVGADRFTGDCGAGALDMMLFDTPSTVDQIAEMMGLGKPVTITYKDKDGKTYTETKIKRLGWAIDLVNAGFKLGYRVSHSNALDCYEACVQIGQNKPFVQLVDYEDLPVRRDYIYKGGHFITVCGVGPEGVTYVDPYATQYFRVVVPWGLWSEIIGRSRYNYPTQGVVRS